MLAHPVNPGGRAGPSAGNTALKKQLLDHVVGYYPPVAASSAAGRGVESDAAAAAEQYALFFEDLMRRTVELVARWQVTFLPTLHPLQTLIDCICSTLL